MQLGKLTVAVAVLGFVATGCNCAGYQVRERVEPGTDEGPCDEGGCDCDADPTGFGCACDAIEPVVCFDADPALSGVGVCTPGVRSCVEGTWDICAGEILPGVEECDEVDNDCDGVVDDGVLSACGDCSEDCAEVTYGHRDGQIPFGADEGNSSGVAEREDGALVLEGDTYQLNVIWIVNTPESTISKIDTETREELARYRTGTEGVAHSPSRTSLDYRGNAYVANRAFSSQASVVKILERDCPDLDDDGRLETSEDRTDVLPWGDDECVAWSTDVGVSPGIGRAVAVQTRIDEDGAATDYAWVGIYDERKYVELDGETGEVTGREVDVTPCTPYGAAIDRDGNLWSACLSSNLARFDTTDLDDVEVLIQPGSNYGITVDEDGIVWTGGQCTRYDPAEGEFTSIAGCGGAGIAADGKGSIWVAGSCGGGGTCRIDSETLELTPVAAQAKGIAVDFRGYLWAIPWQGWVEIIDPGDGPGDETVERVLDDCEGPGGACLNSPYTYSDMSGFQLQNATTPTGSWQTVIEGCDEPIPTRWVRIGWDAETEDGATSVTLQVRAADSLEALESKPWVTAATAPVDAPPVDLEAAMGGDQGARFLGVQAVLTTVVHGATPVLHSLSVQRSCSDGLR